jgi:hypothetical protein
VSNQQISLHLLTNVLLYNPVAKASVIDTTGSFSVSLLAKIIRHRTAPQLGQASHGVEKVGIAQALDERVQEILGRVAISRVFDIEGIWEVLSEISAGCQSPIPERDLSNLAEKVAEDADRMPGEKLVVPEAAGTKSSGLEVEVGGEKELEIGDSDAEDEDIDLEDELQEAGVSHRGRTNVVPDNADAPRSLHEEEDPTLRSKPPENIERTEIIIIDNMTTPTAELFSRRERSSGTSHPSISILSQRTSANLFPPTTAHTLLSTFSRTLHTLSQTHNILTILLNILTYPPARGSSRGASRPSASRLPTKPISIFAATTARPALGRLFSDLCALHLLVTSVPKTPKDAELLYVSPPDPSDEDESRMPQGREERMTGVEYAFVVEVLKDTTPDLSSWLELSPSSHDTASIQPFSSHFYDRRTPHERSEHSDPTKRKRKQNRSQRWAPFTISPNGLELQDAFPDMIGRPKSASGQTHIAKQFPFGRRA